MQSATEVDSGPAVASLDDSGIAMNVSYFIRLCKGYTMLASVELLVTLALYTLLVLVWVWTRRHLFLVERCLSFRRVPLCLDTKYFENSSPNYVSMFFGFVLTCLLKSGNLKSCFLDTEVLLITSLQGVRTRVGSGPPSYSQGVFYIDGNRFMDRVFESFPLSNRLKVISRLFFFTIVHA